MPVETFVNHGFFQKEKNYLKAVSVVRKNLGKMLVIFVHSLKSFMHPQNYLHEFCADYELFLLLCWGCSFSVGFVSLCYHDISWWHLQLKWQLKIYQSIMYWINHMILLKRKNNQEIIAWKVWYLWCYLWQGFWWNKTTKKL